MLPSGGWGMRYALAEAISLMDNSWKKTVIRSTRFSPVLMDMIKTECKCGRIDFSNYIRFAAETSEEFLLSQCYENALSWDPKY